MPDEILVLMLSRLALREAVRTSVLSKRWRYVWTCISVLNFDAAVGNIGKTNSVNWVYCVLEKYKALNIDEFRVNFDLRNKHRSDIDRWVEFALSNRVHTFELNLLGNDNNQSNYTFPCQLLGLSSKGPCLRNPSMFVGFKSLKSLSLKAVDRTGKI